MNIREVASKLRGEALKRTFLNVEHMMANRPLRQRIPGNKLVGLTVNASPDTFGWVWMISLSRWTLKDGQPYQLGTSTWGALEIENAIVDLENLLRGVGDKSRQLAYRMEGTVGIERALWPEECAKANLTNLVGARTMTGGPIEVLHARGLPDAGNETWRPCHNPGRDTSFRPDRPDLWIPKDCGACPPCVARAAKQQEVVGHVNR